MFRSWHHVEGFPLWRLVRRQRVALCTIVVYRRGVLAFFVPGFAKSDQRSAGRPWIRTPIHDRLAARGAVFGEVHGYQRPRWFVRDGVAARRPV